MSGIEVKTFAKRPSRPHPALSGAAGTELPLIATYIYTGESQGCLWSYSVTAYLIAAGCRFSKDLAGFGGAATSNPALLSVGDLWIRGDPSALVKKIQKIGKAPQARTWQRWET